ncbi:MAG: NAD(P)H-dependent glycerol-3-phosphate dehydrogenase [Alphaproteobacteria bacterium]|nr:NAD(P)H-dependent glycerol-3-phosphate dehydrogenase [Alphaproteobacteria bacterium]
MNDVAVWGAGAWGQALAMQAHAAGARVTLWARSGLVPRLPVALPAIAVTRDINEARGALTIIAVPVQHLRAVCGALAPRPALLACKGVEAATTRFPTEILAWPSLGVISGPNFAAEIARGLPAASVIASLDDALREGAIAALGTAHFRLYASTDVLGVQAGGAAKNVLAIAAGTATGAGLGENARAALITRGLAELTRLVLALGGRAETAAGLSGLGDLLLTASSATSRNTALGIRLGQGTTLEAALAASQGVAEGVATAPALLARAGDIEMPICAATAAMLSGRATVREAMAALLARPLRVE